MFVDYWKATFRLGKEPPIMTTTEELKKDPVCEEWEKLINQD